MEIHFFDSDTVIPDNTDQFFGDFQLAHGWVDTIRAINAKTTYIYTTQMGVLSTKLFEFGYRVFIYPYDDEAYEIKLGSDNTCTNREIRMEHNLFNLWKSGEFF